MSDDNHKPPFEAVISAMADALLVFCPDGHIIWVNQAAELIFGLSEKVLIGKRINDLFHRDKRLAISLTEAMQRRISFIDHDAQLHHSHQSMPPIPVVVSIHPVLGNGKDNGGWTLLIRDQTTFKSLERFSSGTRRTDELTTLAAGVAHEIKNPLGGVRGAAQLIDAETSGSLADYTSLIIREVDRIDRLVIDLITINQPDDFEKHPTNLYPVIDDVLGLLRPAAEVKSLDFIKQYDPSLPKVMGDPDRLRQIFLNLVKNGIEASGSDGKIILRTSLDWKRPRIMAHQQGLRFVLVEIIDYGSGLSDEAARMLYNPFYTSGKKKGTGLGLAMTRRMVQAHGGVLEIRNRNDGEQGVRASVYLPSCGV